MNNLEQIIEYQERVLEFLKREFEKEADISKVDNSMPEAEKELEFDDSQDKKLEETL